MGVRHVLLSTLGRDCFALFPAQERVHVVLCPSRSAPRGRPHPPTPRVPRRRAPSGGSGPEGPRVVGPVCGESGDTRKGALPPPDFRPAGSTTLLTTRGSAQRRNPASPACLRAVRALLSFHWAQWPSITEAGGRACALSAAIATAWGWGEQTRAAEERAAVARALSGAQVGDMVSAVGPQCSSQPTAFRVRIFSG